MAFQVGDIVKKIAGFQKYKIVEVLENSKYKCQQEPQTAKFYLVFKEAVLEKVE
jgi:NADPH-dependent curcumin reductase CurA